MGPYSVVCRATRSQLICFITANYNNQITIYGFKQQDMIFMGDGKSDRESV